jgi:hypothetical protein
MIIFFDIAVPVMMLQVGSFGCSIETGPRS